MIKSKKSERRPDALQQKLLQEVRVEVATPAQLPRLNRLLKEHHYLGSLRPVGQRLHYSALNAAGDWVAVLVFSAPARCLKSAKEIGSLVAYFKALPEYRARVEAYPLFSLAPPGFPGEVV